MQPAHGYRENLTATGDGQTAAVHGACLHTWQIVNNNGSQATVRPYGSLAETADPLASAAWTPLGAANTDIAGSATAIISIADTQLNRVKLNVVTLAGDSLDVIYLGRQET